MTKHKKLIELQKIKSANAKKLFVAVISNSMGREVRTGVIGKDLSWDDLSSYTLEQFNISDEESEYVYMVSLFEISRKALYGDKNTEGLKDFRNHSSHFLVEHGNELELGDFV